MASDLRVVEDATCLACGCACDDIDITVAGGRITKARNACVLGKKWFGLGEREAPDPLTPAALPRSGGEGNEIRIAEGPGASVDGAPTALDQALDEAARILKAARYPLVYGLRWATCEAQRLAVDLAEAIGACLDVDATPGERAFLLASRAVGVATCTLGEVRQRADLVVFWGGDPLESHPRHWGRYSVSARGRFVAGRRERTVVVVSSGPTKSAHAADLAVAVAPGQDYEVLAMLRAAVKGIPIDQTIPAPLTQLADRMRACRYGVLFLGDGLIGGDDGLLNAEAALGLVNDLNQITRFRALPLGGPGNAVGAFEVLTWRTGAPFAISFAAGEPRWEPHEYSAAGLLARGEPDAVLLVCADMAGLPAAAREHLTRIPVVALDWRPSDIARQARVAVTVARPDLAGGTAYRVDGVPLSLRGVLPAPLTLEQALHLLGARSGVPLGV